MANAQVRKYKRNKFFLTLVGAWPWQSKISRRIALLAFFFISGTQMCCQSAAVVKAGAADINVIIECGTSISVKITILMKFVNLMVNGKKMKILLDQMLNDNEWSADSEEDLIMQSYVAKGQSMTTIMSYYTYIPAGLHNFLPILPQILGTLGNQSRRLPNRVYYPIDMEKYYYPIFFHGVVGMWIFCGCLLAADTLFVVFVEHACGMFSVIGYKIRNAVTETDQNMDINIRECDDVTYKNFIECIKLHKKAIKFSEIIESAHHMEFLFVIGLSMLTVSVTGVTMVMGTYERRMLIRQTITLLSVMVHLYVENYCGQRLLEHSLSVYTNILYSDWYRSSPRTKKLLRLFMMRSLVPCVLTMGGRFVMCMENFSAILRTSASYFTILRSAQ